jgi:DNA mismatch repair protein MutL
VSVNPQYNPFKTTSSNRSSSGWEKLYEGLKPTVEQQATLFENTDVSPAASDTATETSLTSSLIDDKSPTHYQYKGMYIMTAVKSGLMIIDQHRAHVRVLYENYLRQLRERTGTSQKVLFPEVIHFSPSELQTFERILPEMTNMGFELTDMGGGSYAVNAVPVGLDGLPVVSLVNDLNAAAGDVPLSVADEVRHLLALELARKAAIPVGQVLGNEEMENLVNQLFSCENVNYTPDGKPVLTIFRQNAIEQLLG